MVGPPPPPPPPPPPSAVVPPSWRTTANAQRAAVSSSPKPSPVQSSRPCVDASALQHAATRLRKTEHGQSLRSDEPCVPDGRVDGPHQRAAGRDWTHGSLQQPMGGYPPREQIHAAPAHSDVARAIGHLRRDGPPLGEQQPQRYVSTATFSSSSSSDYSVPAPRINSPYSSSSSAANNNTYSSFPYTAPSSSYASPFASSSSWVSQIDETIRDHSASPQHLYSHHHPPASSLYAVPTRVVSPHRPVQQQQQQQYSNNNDGLLYSAINKSSGRSRSPPASTPLAHPPPSSLNLAPHHNPSSDFARELRDLGLTDRQRAANEHKSSERRLPPTEIDASAILQAARDGDEISRLVGQMNAAMGGSRAATAAASAAAAPPPPVQQYRPPPTRAATNMTTTTTTTTDTVTTRNGGGAPQTLRGKVCVNCHQEVTNDKPGCTALNQIFHVACFVCSKCSEQLAGASFYNVDGKPICEKDYVDSLERCAKCAQPISDRLLRAVGGAFHVACFTCVVCNIALDGIPFTVDPDNRVHCVPCFHEAFAPRCTVCTKPIVPQEGEKESVRVVAMDKSFHVECYRCEDCGTQLSSKIEGQGCYPLDSHLYCKTCNGNRLRLLAAAQVAS